MSRGLFAVQKVGSVLYIYTHFFFIFFFQFLGGAQIHGANADCIRYTMCTYRNIYIYIYTFVLYIEVNGNGMLCERTVYQCMRFNIVFLCANRERERPSAHPKHTKHPFRIGSFSKWLYIHTHSTSYLLNRIVSPNGIFSAYLEKRQLVRISMLFNEFNELDENFRFVDFGMYLYLYCMCYIFIFICWFIVCTVWRVNWGRIPFEIVETNDKRKRYSSFNFERMMLFF